MLFLDRINTAQTIYLIFTVKDESEGKHVLKCTPYVPPFSTISDDSWNWLFIPFTIVVRVVNILVILDLGRTILICSDGLS